MNNKGLIITTSILLAIIIGLILVNIGKADDIAYKRTMESENIELCQEFLDRFGDSEYADKVKTYKMELEALKEEQDYQSMLSLNDVQACKDFALKHPNNPHIEELRGIIEDMDFEIAMDKDEIETYSQFLSTYPGSNHNATIKKIIDQKEDNYYKTYINIPISQLSESQLRQYSSIFPSGKYKNKVKEKLAELTDATDYNAALNSNTQYSYEHYISTHPSGKYVSAARNKIKEFKEIEYYKTYSLANGATPYSKWYGSSNSCSSWYCSQIVITAPYNSDVVAFIKNSSGSVVRHAYIRAGRSFTFDVPDGTYQPYFYYGKGWYPNKKMAKGRVGGFLQNETSSYVRSTYLDSQIWTIKLELTTSGNLSSHSCSEADMF